MAFLSMPIHLANLPTNAFSIIGAVSNRQKGMK